MKNLATRIKNYIHTCITFSKAGVTFSSLLLWPIRRRLPHSRNQIDLKTGISIILPADSPFLDLFTEIWIRNCYMPSRIEVKQGSTIVDVGANGGLFTIWAAINYPHAKIVALEPSPRIFDFLFRNIFINKLGNVQLLQAACGGRMGEALLYSRGGEELNTLFCQDIFGSSFRPLCRTPLVTIEHVFKRFDVQRCGLLKLDCEGSEYDILLNTKHETLQRIERIAMEYHTGFNEHSPGELVTFLESHSFKVTQSPMRDDGTGYMYAKRSA